MENWLKEKHLFLESLLIFIIIFTMIGFSSDNIRYFLLNITEVVFGSLFITFIIYSLTIPFRKEDSFSFSLFWAAIALGITIGRF